MSDALFGGKDPGSLFFKGKVQTIEQIGTGYVLRFPLPLANKNQIDLMQTGDELVVQVGDYKRNIILPRALALLQVAGAKLENGELRITFAAPSTMSRKSGVRRHTTDNG
jgi:arsenite/tail-anchored protein-transporting ATPase